MSTNEDTINTINYAPPPLRIAATYPATDGRVPEEIVIEFGESTIPVDPKMVDYAVDALARVAAGRDRGNTIITPVRPFGTGRVEAGGGSLVNSGGLVDMTAAAEREQASSRYDALTARVAQ